MAMLVRTQGGREGKWVYAVGPHCVLGGQADCEISDIFAENDDVSPIHAQVDAVGGRYYVEDRGSRSGTFLNKRRLTSRTRLRSGDHLLVAGVELIFLQDAVAADQSNGTSSTSSSPVSFAELLAPATPLSSVSVAATDGGSAATLAGLPAEKLRALAQMLKLLGRSLDIDATMHELLSGLFAIFPQAECGFVAFTAPGQTDVTPRATHFRHEEASPRVRISRTLVRHVLSCREAILWADHGPEQGALASHTLVDFAIHSLMCAPLLDGDGNPFGVVQIDTDHPVHEFTREDLDVMVGAVSQAAMVVRFAKLHEDALRSQAVERDLALARRVQLGLLPEGYPDCEDVEFFAYYHAAYDVGGDYYDFIELPNDRLAMIVADAAGKGVSAALMMAKLSGELKYYLSCDPPGIALARMNDSLCAGATGRFVTLLAAILDRRASTLTLVNAGHPAPLRRRADGTVEVVGESARGAALGLLPDQRYSEVLADVEPGDVWMVYTDGFTEATSANDGMFSAERLRDRLAQAPPRVRDAGDGIVHEVRTFMGDHPQSDDMCLVAWGRSGGAPGRAGAHRHAESEMSEQHQ
jgi:phosphoserine phosphatase RsbU/P